MDWSQPYEVLRRRWGRVPAGPTTQLNSTALLEMGESELWSQWQAAHARASIGDNSFRGWYHKLYRDELAGRRVLDLGCGFGLSSFHFALHGARLTFADIIPENVEVMRRLCSARGIEADFLYIEDERSFLQLPHQYDFIAAIGSLINAPLEVTRAEIQAVLPYLEDGGRWLHFAYPKARWEKAGSPPFAEWGVMTDGEGTPWMEYHDWPEVQALFEPYRLDLVFDCQWHHNDFNWFDLRVHRPSELSDNGLATN